MYVSYKIFSISHPSAVRRTTGAKSANGRLIRLILDLFTNSKKNILQNESMYVRHEPFAAV